MEEAFFDTPLYREFAQLQEFARPPDESTILRFRHRLEKHKLAGPILTTVNEVLIARGLLLKVGTVVDATLIAAPSSTKNKDGLRDPEMHSAQNGNQWHFGMKAHIGVDGDSGLVHTVRGTSANVNDVVEGNALLHGEEEVVSGDAGYHGVDKRQFDWVKVRYRGLKKNTAQLVTLFALSNLWMVRGKLLAAAKTAVVDGASASRVQVMA